MNVRICNQEELERFARNEANNGLLPWQFYKEFLKVLQYADAKFLTINDCYPTVEWENITPESFKHALRQEYAEWGKTSESHLVYVLLLHDCDSAPAKSVTMCEIEKEMGIVSTLSVFPRWPYFNQNDICLFPIDFIALKTLQDQGFAFSYHCNAAQLCDGNEKDVFRCYDEDVDYLREQGFDIQWYAAHGGRDNKAGRKNYSYFYPASVKNTMPSTHNLYGLFASAYYSDGSFKPTCDIRLVLQNNLTIGDRIKILMHPCYFGASNDTTARKYFDSHPFVKEYWDLYHKNKTDIYWRTTIQNIHDKKILHQFN